MDNKFFKRFILLALTAAMCVTLVSCGEKREKKSALEEASTSEEQTKLLEEAKSQSKLNKDKDEENKEKPKDSKTEKKDLNEKENIDYDPGKLTETTYESEFVGVKFVMPEGYEMEKQEVLDQYNAGLAAAEDEGQKYMRYEAIIKNPDENIQVIVSVDGNKGEYDEMQYLANVAANYENSVEGAEVDRTALNASIAGQDYTSMKIKMNMGSALYCVRKKGEDMLQFVISYPTGEEDKLNTIMDAFQPY